MAEKIIKRAVRFTNIDKELFSCECDGYLYEIPAGTSQMLQEPIARYLAKHLAQKLTGYIRMSKLDDHGVPVDSVVRDLYTKILSNTGIEAKSDAELINKMVNNNDNGVVVTPATNTSQEIKSPAFTDLPEPTNDIERIVNDEINQVAKPMELVFAGRKYATLQSYAGAIGIYRKNRIEELTAEKDQADASKGSGAETNEDPKDDDEKDGEGDEKQPENK